MALSPHATSNDKDAPQPRTATLDLTWLPLTFVLATHFTPSELADFEQRLVRDGARLTYDAAEAGLFIGKVERRGRAALELRSRGVWTEEIAAAADAAAVDPPLKRARLVLDASGSETESDKGTADEESASAWVASPDVAVVLKKSWVDESDRQKRLLPLSSYTVYTGRIVRATTPSASQSTQLPHKPATLQRSATFEKPRAAGAAILERARADVLAAGKDSAATHGPPLRTKPRPRAPALLTESTSDHEDVQDLPPPPEWLIQGLKYSCQRSTPVDNPNQEFISLLKYLRTVRKLQADEIGVRAYSSAIASVAAYPHYITHRAEITRLPGCSGKIAGLWSEWAENGRVRETDEAKRDERLVISELFYHIWGVGANTARSFYDRGWRDLDDVVEFGWDSLLQRQQIGLKYYHEFLLKVPRHEGEQICGIVVRAFQDAVRQRGGDAALCRHCIVGGYRRGKAESGDVDVVVSHPDEAQTLDLIAELITRLADEGWITHNLGVTTSTSQRGQATLPSHGSRSQAGHGFDSLDKALVVWQHLPDPLPSDWAAMDQHAMADYRKAHPETLQGKPHRRVDIIVAPWERVGCAVLGWSAGTTFERDLRRYTRHVKQLKFDSSGVRDLKTGQVVDLERRPDGSRCESIDEAERRVFEGLGLVYRPPEERCTG